MPNQHKMIRRQPAARWQDALPAGNGTIGASAYGCIRNETILINHEMLWRWSAPPDMVDVSERLPELRALLEERRFDEASSFLYRALEDQDRRSLMRRGLDQLPDKLREAVILRDLQGLTYHEMATRLALPEGTVKSRINRGREELARLLLRAQQPGRGSHRRAGTGRREVR